jgi:MYXO-CTERM domain-containing protein
LIVSIVVLRSAGLAHDTRNRGLLARCAAAAAGGGAWIALGVAFLVLGISSPSGAYIGVGAAFLVIGLGRAARRRRRSS